MLGTSTRLYNFELSFVPWHSSGIASATLVHAMRYHMSGFVTMRHCYYLSCAILRIYRVDVARQCDEICWYFHTNATCFPRRFRVSCQRQFTISLLPVTSSPTGTCAGFSTSRSTWYYCRIFCYVTITFNGYGSRPYVNLFTTSKTSSFVVIRNNGTPASCSRSRYFTLCLFAGFTLRLTRWLLRGLRPSILYCILRRNFVPKASCRYPCTIA